MARRVRVANRAIRRGRRLRARPSEVPPSSSEQAAAAGGAAAEAQAPSEPVSEPVPTPITRRTDDDPPAVTKPDRPSAEPPKARFSRPSVPLFDLSSDARDSSASAREESAGDHDEDEVTNELVERADEDEDEVTNELAADEDAAPDAVDDEAEAESVDAESAEVPEARTSAYSRPPAPTLDFDGPDSEPADPNATTLVSHSGPRPSRPPASRISVEVAADAADGSGAEGEEAPSFVPEDQEPPISEASSGDTDAVTSSLEGEGFRSQDSTLAPVVDEPVESEEPEPALFAPEDEKRRRTLRRAVGAGVVAVALVTLGVVAKSTMSEPEAAASSTPTSAAVERDAKTTNESKPAEDAKPAQPAPPIATVDAEESDVGADLPEDIAELEKQTLELLNDRKFEESIPFAKKLIEMKPESAFGYRCLGSALQDLGRYNEAQKVYSDCATQATKGEFLECTALGGADRKVLPQKPAKTPDGK